MSDATVQSSPLTLGAVYELNLNLFTFAARCVATGDSNSLKRIGLSADDIPHLERISLAEILTFSRQGAELSSALSRIRLDESLRDQLLIHGAPRTLMNSLFGINARQYQLRRSQLNVVRHVGRPSTHSMDNALEQQLWKLWVCFADDKEPRTLRAKEHWLLIALELPGHLRNACGVVNSWAKDKCMVEYLRAERSRLGPDQIAVAEAKLRQKHNL